jgi:hypothetical protein
MSETSQSRAGVLSNRLGYLRQHGLRVAVEIGVNLIAPVLVYDAAKPGYGEVGALLLSSLPPIVWSVVEFIRSRKLDALSMLVLAGIVLSLLAFVGGGGARMLQLREKLVTGLIGLVFLGSIAIGKPLIYALARAGAARKSPDEAAELEGLRGNVHFERVMRFMTLVWGLGLVGEAAVSAGLVYLLPVRTYLIVGPILGYATMGGLSVWNFWYARRKKLQGRARRAAAAQAAALNTSP